MKITLKKIISESENIKKLQEIKLPVKASYRINRIVSKIIPDITEFNKKRDELLKEVGVLDEKTNIYTITKEKLPEFNKQIEELLDLSVDIDLEPISISELGDIEIESSLLVDFLFKD